MKIRFYLRFLEDLILLRKNYKYIYDYIHNFYVEVNTQFIIL